MRFAEYIYDKRNTVQIKTKRHSTEWEKILVLNLSDKG